MVIKTLFNFYFIDLKRGFLFFWFKFKRTCIGVLWADSRLSWSFLCLRVNIRFEIAHSFLIKILKTNLDQWVFFKSFLRIVNWVFVVFISNSRENIVVLAQSVLLNVVKAGVSEKLRRHRSRAHFMRVAHYFNMLLDRVRSIRELK